MVDICQEFATRRNLKFSNNENPEKSKTKCLIFSKNLRDRQNILPILLNGDPLPWVTQVKHLGSTLQLDNSMRMDMCQKRGQFIGKVSSLLQEFHYVSPEVFVKIVNIFATSFYGSGLWDILSSDCDKLFKSWNVCIRMAYDVDICTHRYLIESISNTMHPKTILASRYVGFYKSLLSSPKMCVRFMARLLQDDLRTFFEKTLDTLARNCGLRDFSQLTPELIKTRLTYMEVPQEKKWRVDTIMEMLKSGTTLSLFQDLQLMKSMLC